MNEIDRINAIKDRIMSLPAIKSEYVHPFDQRTIEISPNWGNNPFWSVVSSDKATPAILVGYTAGYKDGHRVGWRFRQVQGTTSLYQAEALVYCPSTNETTLVRIHGPERAHGYHAPAAETWGIECCRSQYLLDPDSVTDEMRGE